MIDLTNRRTREVGRAQRVFAEHGTPFGHVHLVRECRRGNPFVLAKLRRKGLTYEGGAIRRVDS